ncbi:MAG: gluconokinase [Cellvibrio sp.]|jgi:gluconokinase|nr:gluconokinase [Cellvibrio sp.]
MLTNSNTNLIIIMGVSASGKSTVANAIAQHFHYCYLDADDFHSEENKRHMASGKPLTDEMRAPWVTNIKNYLERAGKNQEHSVLAFSGLKKQHRDELRQAGLNTIFIFLNGNKTTIQERINLRKDHFMSPNLVDSQFAALESPLSEADVYPIEVFDPIERVVSDAVSIIDLHLLGNSRKQTA